MGMSWYGHLVEQAADLVIVQDGLLEFGLVLLPLAECLGVLVMHSLQRSSHLPATQLGHQSFTEHGPGMHHSNANTSGSTLP